MSHRIAKSCTGAAWNTAGTLWSFEGFMTPAFAACQEASNKAKAGLTDGAGHGGNVGLALHGEAQRLAAAKAVLQSVRSRPSLAIRFHGICTAFSQSVGLGCD